MVIVETAIAIPAMAIVGLSLAWMVGGVARTVALGDTASRIAREVSRGGDAETVVDSARERNPALDVHIDHDARGDVVVTAQEPYRAPGVLAGLTLTLTRTVVAPTEQW